MSDLQMGKCVSKAPPAEPSSKVNALSGEGYRRLCVSDNEITGPKDRAAELNLQFKEKLQKGKNKL